MPNLAHITHLTFDCYGTLIDWEAGILEALQPLLTARAAGVSAQNILQLYVKHEAELEAGPWQPYRTILREVAARIGRQLGVILSQVECDTLPDSIDRWPPFPDTVASLQTLSTRYKLVILSNIDDALFAATAPKLNVSFAEVITAEQVRSYKPGEAHFREAIRRLNVPATQILHVAQSLCHDHGPAHGLGFHTAWINRPSRLPGTGLSPAAQVEPDLKLSSLAELLKSLAL